MDNAALLEGRDQITWMKLHLLNIHTSSLTQMMSNTTTVGVIISRGVR